MLKRNDTAPFDLLAWLEAQLARVPGGSSGGSGAAARYTPISTAS